MPNIQVKNIEKEVEVEKQVHVPGKDIIRDKVVEVEYEETHHVEVENHVVTQVPKKVRDEEGIKKMNSKISVLEDLLR